MLRDYLNERGITVYHLARSSGIPYSTLNDLVNRKVSIDNCKVGLLHTLADALELSLDEMYKISCGSRREYVNCYDITVELIVRNKSYYALFEYQGRLVELELCKVNNDTTFYIEEIVKWSTERYIRESRMRAFH